MLLVTVPMHFYGPQWSQDQCPSAEPDPLPGSVGQTWPKQFHCFCQEHATSVEIPHVTCIKKIKKNEGFKDFIIGKRHLLNKILVYNKQQIGKSKQQHAMDF